MEALVVANPVSGGGRAARAATALARALETRGHRVELLLTERAGHAAQRIAAGPLPERVVAVGGDGTVNEIVGALPAGVVLGVLPTGTANVLARELDLPRDVARAARIVERGATRTLDVGRVVLDDGTARRFVCMGGAGFDARVTRLVAASRRGTQGFAAYAAPIAAALRGYAPPALTVRVDDGATVEGGWVLVSLVRNYGGLFAIADGARPGAGRFEVVIVHEARTTRLAALALAGLRGAASGVPGVTRLRGTDVRIEGTTDFQVDGDWIGPTPARVSLLPRALRVAARS